MSRPPILEVSGLCKSFGAVTASDFLDLRVEAGEIHALIGPNGAGKSTLILQLSGELSPDRGAIRFSGRDVTRLAPQARTRLGIARSYQITSIFPEYTVLSNVALAVAARTTRGLALLRGAAGDPDLEKPAREALARVGLAGAADRPAAALSHGEQRQLEFAMALALSPRLLLLDEPMAGMGAEETRRLSDILREIAGDITILLVEHDMDVVFALADRITVLVYGRAIASGRPDEIRRNAEVRTAYLGTGAA